MALERIEDEACVNFVPPTRQVPGAGLAGEHSVLMCRKKHSPPSSSFLYSPPSSPFPNKGYFWSQVGTHNRHNFLGKDRKDTNVWRDTAATVNDPDQPPYPRMAMLEQAGYGKACGVPFDIRGHRGVVLYFARATADRNQLTELANDMHLRVSADLIGAISANSITSEASLLSKGNRLAKPPVAFACFCSYRTTLDACGSGEEIVGFRHRLRIKAEAYGRSEEHVRIRQKPRNMYIRLELA